MKAGSRSLQDLRFWAKTRQDGMPGIDVHEHLLRVGVVATLLADERAGWLRQLGVEPDAAAALAGLHDIGKISPGFQSKCPAWLQQNGLAEESTRCAWANLQRDHSRISQFTLQRFLAGPEVSLTRSTANWWATAVGCHHGRIHYPGERGLQPEAGMTADEWEETRKKAVLRFLTEMEFDLPSTLAREPVMPDSPVLWAVAGLTSVADWIGSDEDVFPADRDVPVQEIRARAAERLDRIGLRLPSVVPGLSFTEIFGFPPYDLQTAAAEFIPGPGIYAIEAPMGTGKTEAALAVAYRLLCAGLATGVYFALPTQATSNRIHRRLNDFVQRICPAAPSARLIHANSWLMEELTHPSLAVTAHGEADARQGRDWFASAKRALLAPFGVGTVDQALLSVVAAKHFFVRRFALGGKVVIVDEVHSYDVYTGTLVGKLCEELVKLGCTVILLSATLTRARRDVLLSGASGPHRAADTDPYPLLTGSSTAGESLLPRQPDGPKPMTIALRLATEAEVLELAAPQAKQGACVLWICNTVDRAQAVRRSLEPLAESGVRVGLLHARFPFFRREELEDDWMTTLGKDGLRPPGCVLVSTQVVEQSVDLDADLMISELAPTDMLLQRIGRLWRHPRGARPVGCPELWLLREARSLEELREMDVPAIRKALGPKAWVYAPYVLLRTLDVWSKRPSIDSPGEIRALLQATYADNDDLPPSWEELRQEIEGQRFAERMIAQRNANLFELALPDDEGVQTRLNNVPTVSLVLAKERIQKDVVLLNGERVHLGGDEFDVATARALHRNLVRVPKRRTFASFLLSKETATHVRGQQALAFVDGSGDISVPGVRSDIRLRWNQHYGVEIFHEGESGDDEPGD